MTCIVSGGALNSTHSLTQSNRQQKYMFSREKVNVDLYGENGDTSNAIVALMSDVKEMCFQVPLIKRSDSMAGSCNESGCKFSIDIDRSRGLKTNLKLEQCWNKRLHFVLGGCVG